MANGAVKQLSYILQLSELDIVLDGLHYGPFYWTLAMHHQNGDQCSPFEGF
jgi:hypothetical protein